MPVQYDQARIGNELFDLKSDVGETTNVIDQHPEIVARLEAAAETARADLGDRLTNRTGAGVRPIGRLAEGDQRLTW